MIDIEMWARRKGQRTPNKGSWLNAVAIGYQVDLSVYKTNVLQGIAELWSAYFHFPITANQVAMAMCLVKISRSVESKTLLIFF